MNISKFIRSFGYAWRGLYLAVRTEQNMRVHLVAAAVVVAAGCFFEISSGDWIAITLCIGSVIALECVNTSIERLADRISTQPDPLIKHAKDVAAAAVLVAAITAVAIACIVFIPKLAI